MTTPPQAHDSKTDLLEAAQAVIKDRKDRASQAQATALTPAARQRVGGLLLLGLVGLLLLIIRPVWLAGSGALPPETPAVSEASLRLSMLRERQRVADFVKQQGRLPTDLAEAGSTVAGLGYEALEGGGFRLFAQGTDSLLVLGSTDSMSLFLGNSLREIKNRGRP